MTVNEEEKKNTEEKKEQDKKPVEVYSEIAETTAPEISDAHIRAMALAYARYLRENGLAPGDATFVDPSELGIDLDAPEEAEEPVPEEEPVAEEEPEAEEPATEEVAEEEAEEPEESSPEEEPEAEETEEPVAEEEPETEESVAEEEPEAEEAEESVSEEEAEEPAAEEEPADEEEPEAEPEAEEAEESAAEEEPATEEEQEEPAAEEEPEAEAEAPADEEAEEPEEAAEPEKKEPEQTEKKEKKKKLSKEDQKKIRQRKKEKKKIAKEFLNGGKYPLASITDIHDRIQDKTDKAFETMGKDIVKGFHRISSGYRNSRRVIGTAVLLTGILVAAILMLFDRFTVYEYAYNGKVLGYVQEQEVVTDVLGIAAKKLSSNNGGVDVEFIANQNVTFNLVDGRGKSTDDADTAVNKLIYMTDLEVEAYAVYDGNKVVAIVKDAEDAQELLEQTKADLSTPDRGMTLVSSEFVNELSTRPINVLLGSVQSNETAKNQMIRGGEMHTYHIVEEGETPEKLAELFGVDLIDIYNEDNSEVVEEIEQGDKVCIRSTVEPVSVKMVEEGKIKEVIEFDTIKQKTDDYYKGDAVVEQEGENGMQIFDGTITKVGGKEVSRKKNAEPIKLKEKKDKIILVGTAKRPKTAATGTFIMPIEHYVVTSEWGGRWGRMHEGMDFGASTGTPIYASDGGRVIKANYWSGHGLCVEIDHGNGVITRYSHCSAVNVSVGDLVYQGQYIANVGNTGHSFGSHLHFEVRVNGVSQNPRNYINP